MLLDGDTVRWGVRRVKPEVRMENVLVWQCLGVQPPACATLARLRLDFQRRTLGVEPGMYQTLCGCRPNAWPRRQHLHYEVLGEFRHAEQTLGVHLAVQVLLQQGVQCPVAEGGPAGEQDVQEHADAKAVYRAAVGLTPEDLRRHVPRRPASHRHHLLVPLGGGQAKVHDLDVVARAYKDDVLRLDVPVDYATLVQEGDGREDLAADVLRSTFRQRPVVAHLGEELAPVDELRHYRPAPFHAGVDVRDPEYAQELEDVGMARPTEDGGLPSQGAGPYRRIGFHHLDCHGAACLQVLGEIHL
mmetsp:Transcript_35298/g.99176  ORF Transcript_35298/g.99176 Transcript_35298/m.99176 type:complete len:301 (+) Transcript_35298:1611-2513(+)